MAKKETNTYDALVQRAVFLLENGDIFAMPEAQLSSLKALVQDAYPDVARKADERLAAFASENHLDTEDVSVYMKNAQTLDEVAENCSYEDMLEDDADIKAFVDQIEITDVVENSEGKQESVVLSPKDKNAHLAVLWKAAQEEAKLSFYGDKKFSKLSKERKSKALNGAAKDCFAASVLTAATGSALEMPSGAEMEIGSEAYKQYQRKLGKSARTVMKQVGGEGKISVKADQIWGAVADTSARIDSYLGGLRQKADKLTGEARHALKSLEARITSGWKKVEEAANHVSNNRYEIFKNVKKSVRAGFYDNKVQTITGLAAIIGMGAGMAINAPVALGAYGAYMAASGYVMPVIAEMRKLKREAKEENRKPLSFKERLKMAIHKKWDKTTVNEEGQEIENPERKKYLRRARITAGIGLVGFAGLAGLVASGAAVAGTAVGNSWALRTLAPITAQGVDLRFAKKRRRKAVAALEESDNEKNQKEFLGAQQEVNNARVAFYVGTLLSAGSRFVSGLVQDSGLTENVLQMGGNSEANIGSDWPKVDTPDWGAQDAAPVQDTTPVMLRGVTDDVLADSSDISNLDDLQLEPMPTNAQLFPREWSQDMGITQKQYNIMMSRLPGIMKDFDNVSLDRAYLNMNDEFMANFDGKSKMEVFYETLALARNSRRSQVVLGNAESGFYINTPTERVAITDEGIIEQAKQALANGDKVYISRLHGREFLRGQFENLKLDGMNDEKMSKIVEIAMKTYDSSEVGNATNQIREMFPDLSKAEVSKISEIVNYNRRFEANGKTLESIFNAIGCGEKIEDGKAANDLIDNAQAILRRSKGPARIVGQNVECNDTVVHIIGGKKVVQTVVDEPYTKTTKVMDVDITESKAELDKPKLGELKELEPSPETPAEKPVEAPTQARHAIVNNQRQIYDGTAKLDRKGRFIQENITGTKRANQLVNQSGGIER